MNFIDRSIEAISPTAGLKRRASRAKIEAFKKVFDSGYSHSGASRQKKSMQGWNSNSKSPQEDIGNNLTLLRQRSRDSYMGSPIATAAIVKNRNNILAAGLTLKCRLDHQMLGITESEARTWEKSTEFKFNIWAKSKIDHTGLNNFFDTQGIMLTGWLLNGDSLAVVKYADAPEINNPYRLRIHCIEADRLSTPDISGQGSFYGFGFDGMFNECSYKSLPNGGAIYNGVETDHTGKVVAYWICNKYPNSDLPPYGAKKWQRVDAINSYNGLPNVLFVMNADRAEQYRGVPLLAPVIEIIKQMTRLTEAELAAAVINSFFTAFIKTNSPQNDFNLSDTVADDNKTPQPSLGERLQTYEMGPGTLIGLGLDEDVSFGDPKHPTSGFEAFTLTMCKLLGAAIDMPYEVLLGVFQSSYSASKAALLQAWRGFKTKRQWFAADYNQLIYEIWLYEAVATGGVSAPGFFTDATIRKLWSNAIWIGPSQGHINPTDEIRAAELRVAGGYTTHESETVEMNGQDWEENVQILARENKMLQTAKASLKGGEKGAQNASANTNQ